MDARELAEKLVNSMTDDEVMSVLNRKSAGNFEAGIMLTMAMHDEEDYESSDVVREIESLLGV